jgi:Flp pilus assembly protein TadG
MLRRFRKDKRGAAAIEFALIAPMMVAFYCCLAEGALGLMAERRASHAASVVADLVAQDSSTTGDLMTDMFFVGNSILSPYDPGPLKLVISSVVADKNVQPQVIWSRGNGTNKARNPNSFLTVFPSGLLVNSGDSVIMAEVSYQYTFPLPGFLPNTMSFSQIFYLKPRRSAQVTCDNNCQPS